MDINIGINGEGAVINPEKEPVLETSQKPGFDPLKVGDARFDQPDNEGGVIAPTKRRIESEGAVMLTGYKVSYYVGTEITSQDVRQEFDTVDDAKASVINAKSCYAMTSRGLKLVEITAGAPRISEGDKETWIYIEGAWKRL